MESVHGLRAYADKLVAVFGQDFQLTRPGLRPGLDPVSWTRGYAAFCVAAVWFEYCSSKVTGVIWPTEA